MDIWGELEANKTPHPHLVASPFGQVGLFAKQEKGRVQTSLLSGSANREQLWLRLRVWALAARFTQGRLVFRSGFLRVDPGRMDWGTECQGWTLADCGE